MVKSYSETEVLNLLKEVMDPEIPVLSLVDLGVITKIEFFKDKGVTVFMRPTFIGCPALHQMKQDIETRLYGEGFDQVDVKIVHTPAWTSDEISEEGRIALKKYGYAPPPKNALIEDIDILENVPCPYCDGINTELKSPFGPTLCRSLHYCRDCREAFQQIKPLS